MTRTLGCFVTGGRDGARSLPDHLQMSTNASSVAKLVRASARLNAERGSTRIPVIRWMARLTRPLRVTAKIAREVKKRGPSCKRAGGPGMVTQATTMWRLATFHRISPASYYFYRLHRRDFQTRAQRYLEFTTLAAAERRILDASSADRAALTDKRAFARLCEQDGFPTPPILAWARGGAIEIARELPASDLFSKPGASANGRGAAIWRFDDGQWSDGTAWHDAESLLAEIARRSDAGPHMLQPRIVNHDAIRGLGCGGASTARIVTIRFPDRPAEPLWSVFKMSARGSAADNFMRGGLLAPVDADSGRLGPALRQGSSALVQTHPDTGAQIAGVKLPQWSQALQLCLRAHDTLFARFPSVGWDVAFTREGPMLIEGNWNWSEELLQLAHDRPLGETRLPDCYLAHLARAGIA